MLSNGLVDQMRSFGLATAAWQEFAEREGSAINRMSLNGPAAQIGAALSLGNRLAFAVFFAPSTGAYRS